MVFSREPVLLFQNLGALPMSEPSAEVFPARRPQADPACRALHQLGGTGNEKPFPDKVIGSSACGAGTQWRDVLNGALPLSSSDRKYPFHSFPALTHA
ncbi:hypothetical protein [Jannaschia donghaensis]|uniref:hypothetical protein n=1 Tax=Jannaschia donghaensis TaxID=420998 RepID=UPI000AB2C393|nr:hypothetical protein [Jannaschia donghaensis]